jgi:hypothetical protein
VTIFDLGIDSGEFDSAEWDTPWVRLLELRPHLRVPSLQAGRRNCQPRDVNFAM